jgi:hypothetical protein
MWAHGIRSHWPLRDISLCKAASPDEIGSNFFWQDGTAPHFVDSQAHDALLLQAFGPLFAALEWGFNPDVAIQFETALCSYYAMNMEILSRVSFDGNDPANSRMTEIFRFEGLEALEPIGMVIRVDGGAAYAAADESGQPLGVSASSRRSALVSSSATMFVRGVDKAGMFPPPIKVITRYVGVPHARIFGTHLFGVDLANARRELPDFLGRGNGSVLGSYSEGCQFFHDYQREFLLMSTGLPVSVTGVVVYSPDFGQWVTLTSDRYAGSLRQVDFLDGVIQIASKNQRAIARLEARCDRWKEFCTRGMMEDRECCEARVRTFENPPVGR